MVLSQVLLRFDNSFSQHHVNMRWRDYNLVPFSKEKLRNCDADIHYITPNVCGNLLLVLH